MYVLPDGFSLLFQVHDSSDTVSAGSPAAPMTGNSVVVSSGSTATSSSLPMSFQRSTEQKLGEKLGDIAVVSLVPPVSIGSSQQSSSSGTVTAASGGTREDYDSSATVRQNSLVFFQNFTVRSIIYWRNYRYNMEQFSQFRLEISVVQASNL